MNINSNKLAIKSVKNYFSQRSKLKGLFFILPALLLNIVFFIYPLFKAFIISFYKWPVLGPKIFLGFKNYINIFSDTVFWDSLYFTFKYTMMVTPLIFILAFLLAMLIKRKLPGTTFFRAIYFMPVVISMVSSSLLWLWIFNDIYGILNFYLQKIGIIDEAVVWMGQASTSLPAISAMITWKMTGFTMIILLAGLQAIPLELYEAAKVDGANKWQQIWKITIPLLRPSMALALIISVIGSVLAFEQFLIMTKGGPANTTTTVVHWIYNTSFKYFHLGYGSSMTFILLAILLLLSWVQMKVIKDPNSY